MTGKGQTGRGLRARWAAAKRLRLSRGWQVGIFLAGIVAAACLFWVLMGARALTVDWAFRRAERQLLAGPSELLGSFEVKRSSDSDYQIRYLVGETDEGLVVGAVSGSWYQGYSVSADYWAKTGDITLVPVDPNWGNIYPYDDDTLVHLLAVADLPGAAYGELELTAQNEPDDPVDEWSMTAQVQDGYLLFCGEDIWEYCVQAIAGSLVSATETAYDLRIYDSQGQLLGQRSWSLSQAREEWDAQARREMEEAGYR